MQSAKSAGAIYEDLGVEVAGIEPAWWHVNVLGRGGDLRKRWDFLSLIGTDSVLVLTPSTWCERWAAPSSLAVLRHDGRLGRRARDG